MIEVPEHVHEVGSCSICDAAARAVEAARCPNVWNDDLGNLWCNRAGCLEHLSDPDGAVRRGFGAKVPRRGHFEPTRDELRRRAALEHASSVVALLEHAAWEFIEYFVADERIAFVHSKACGGDCAYRCGGLFVVLPPEHERRTS